MKSLYQKKLSNPLWQKRRLEILQRDGFICQKCNDDKTELHVHHKNYKGEPWEADSDDLESLCAHCHLIISKFKYSYIKILKYRISGDQSTPNYCICLDEEGSVDLVSFKVDGSLEKIVMTFPENSVLIKDMYMLMFNKNG